MLAEGVAKAALNRVARSLMEEIRFDEYLKEGKELCK